MYVYLFCVFSSCIYVDTHMCAKYICRYTYTHISACVFTCMYTHVYPPLNLTGISREHTNKIHEICMYIHIYRCIYIYVSACVCLYVFIHMCAHTWILLESAHSTRIESTTCLCIYTYVCICTHKCVCVFICMYTHVCTHLHIYVYIYIYTYAYVHTFMYTHVYSHLHLMWLSTQHTNTMQRICMCI